MAIEAMFRPIVLTRILFFFARKQIPFAIRELRMTLYICEYEVSGHCRFVKTRVYISLKRRSYSKLAEELFMNQSEVHSAVKCLKHSRLIDGVEMDKKPHFNRCCGISDTKTYFSNRFRFLPEATEQTTHHASVKQVETSLY